ncbi:AraC-type DNA-binding protein [Mucilaginibacter gossypiicola]|uniref:AraC-type DNA-binding protein n=1 Tax=Mucilaginibacter gossypiicola TaxID=551995 RepID=A0A1H8D8P3_9SPHI|nr:helix-turn-helix transcriptional regulator [Mucilaginibacter gossypiicola]SEN03623.1 AraC-type DNA-binding protein [Mucilaginibacter gossypiicola]
MSFTNLLPAIDWREHIAAYWARKTEPDETSFARRVYADGCIDLIYNAGYSIAHFYPMAGQQMEIPLRPGQLYLGGTMTAYGVLKSDVGCLLTGIRFWPGGFYALFPKTTQPAVDSLIEFPNEELCKLMGDAENIDIRLDQWFADRLAPKPGKYDFAFLRKRMYNSGGQVSVEELAEEMFVSNRTLERIFKQNVGIPPKEFLRIVRFREVLKRLRNAPPAATKESLLQIAFELGYFDHAHLTNEFKKYSGVLPSELSHFYKTGIAGGLYF